MTKPLISILIPVYKVEQYIEQCLRSLFANTIIHECEVIIVDDCSPDKSMEVVHRVLADFPAMKDKVMLHSHDTNRGSAAARNTGLLQAQGRYIICVDSDDWVEPDYLECLYNEAERTNADVVFCDLFQEFANSTKIVQEGKGTGCYVKQLLQEKIHGWLHVKLIRRALLGENAITWMEGLDMCEDVLIMTKVFHHAQKVVHLPLPLYHYRCTNDNSLTRKLNTKKILQLQGVVRELENYLPSEYINVLKSFKSKTKVWILKSADELSSELLNLYNGDILSQCKYNSLVNRLFFFFCEHQWYGLVRLILRLKGRRD